MTFNKSKLRKDTIQECIDVIQKLIKPTCDDHTPYRGPCSSCGSYDNPDFIDPEETILELNLLKNLKK